MEFQPNQMGAQPAPAAVQAPPFGSNFNTGLPNASGLNQGWQTQAVGLSAPVAAPPPQAAWQQPPQAPPSKPFSPAPSQPLRPDSVGSNKGKVDCMTSLIIFEKNDKYVVKIENMLSLEISGKFTCLKRVKFSIAVNCKGINCVNSFF